MPLRKDTIVVRHAKGHVKRPVAEGQDEASDTEGSLEVNNDQETCFATCTYKSKHTPAVKETVEDCIQVNE